MGWGILEAALYWIIDLIVAGAMAIWDKPFGNTEKMSKRQEERRRRKHERKMKRKKNQQP